MSLKAKIFSLLPSSLQQKLHKVKQDKMDLQSKEEIITRGYNLFLKTGQTPPEAFLTYVNLYCSTNGQISEKFNDTIRKNNPPRAVSSTLHGIVGNLSTSDFNKINSTLNEDGYVHFEQKLPKETCAKLYSYALTIPAVVPGFEEKIIFDPENLLSEIYRLEMGVIANNLEVQKLIMDPTLINIARNYLGCEPIFDFPAMWWSTAFKKEASSEAAQLYHFDLDRIKWLKIFFYVNEVTPENGPHCYIRGSHKPGSKPEVMLKKGYARITDEELLPYYKPTDVKIVCGEAGSMFAGDTKCWHKGTNLIRGHRLVLELEYTSSLFCANYPKLEVSNPSPEFKNFCENNKVYASNIHFKN